MTHISIGVICGREGVGFDFDSAEDFENFRKTHLDPASTFVAKTERSFHIYLRPPRTKEES